MIKAVIFDFDGLILDTESASYYTFRDMYREYGLDLPLSVYQQCIGTTFQHFDPYADLSGKAKVERASVEQQFRTKYAEWLAGASLRPGVVDYLDEAKRLGLRIGLASSSHMAWIERFGGRFGILSRFEVMLTADQVAKVKPDPALYVKALAALGVEGREAIAFEDSLHGLHAAKDAGLHCVVVPNEVTSHFAFDRHDLRIESMAERPLHEIVAYFQDH